VLHRVKRGVQEIMSRGSLYDLVAEHCENVLNFSVELKAPGGDYFASTDTHYFLLYALTSLRYRSRFLPDINQDEFVSWIATQSGTKKYNSNLKFDEHDQSDGVVDLAYQVAFLVRNSLSADKSAWFLQKSDTEDLKNVIDFFEKNAPYEAKGAQESLYSKYIAPLGVNISYALSHYDIFARKIWCREYCLRNIIANDAEYRGYTARQIAETQTIVNQFGENPICSDAILGSRISFVQHFEGQYGIMLMRPYTYISETLPESHFDAK
jgi:hypothetical protein